MKQILTNKRLIQAQAQAKRSFSTTVVASNKNSKSHIPFPGGEKFSEPVMKTSSVPGPKSKELSSAINKIQDLRTTNFVANYEKSSGNWLVDADDNVLLDTFGQISSIPLGYNHPDFCKLFSDPRSLQRMTSHFINRPSTGVYPPHDYLQILQESFMRVLPKGTNQVMTMGSGSEAIENAMKAAFMWYQNRAHHSKTGNTPSQEYMDSCMTNQAPGSPDLSILTFTSSFHGRTLGALSATHSKPIHKVDIPAFKWPIAPFPSLKYPLKEFASENRKEEERCLAAVEEILAKSVKGTEYYGPVAAVLIEPILAEGGDRHASPFFFQGLRRLTQQYGVAFICDEVQSGGGATGKFWAHEHWGLGENGPDIVCFSKKMQAAGYYHKAEFAPAQTYRIFNTWLGDPLRGIQLKTMIDVVERDQLLDHVNRTGEVLQKGLMELQERYPALVSNVRGTGTFCAYDIVTVDKRTELVGKMRNSGVEMGVSGERSVRLRPHLIFSEHHVNIYLNRLENALKSL